ncbi:XRE family transcriptional regulator [Citreicella sp. C3M06]|uniref:XRE family transcriptional regulator n=1 Tax=Citreicella sp. C3M06 TaxID=2841564 RepID=UPI001C09AB77|nr:XRE family transcriptional regulator [Citreicella sp. C3M06]MBU2959806.1 XRE family transcriptional regulator [Citreicella sp. C3M06]
MANKPFADTDLAKFVERRVLELKPRKSQLQIANETGFVNQNMVTMIKQGVNKLALDRVPSMAKALDCDPAYLLRLALAQQVGDTSAQAIIEIFGTPITANELGWIEAIREFSDDADPRLTTRSRTALRAVFGA